MFSDLYLYLSTPQVSCFDGEEGSDPPAGDPPAGDPPAGDPPAGDPPAGAGEGDGKTFKTADVNRIVQERLERDRKSRESAHAAKYTDLEGRYSELLENSNLDEEQRGKLNEQLEDVRKQLRTKEQQAAHERKLLTDDHDAKLSEAKESAVVWEDRFRESSISRALQDAAASNDAWDSDQIIALLRPMTKLVEVVDENTNMPTGDYNTVVDFSDVDEKGLSVVTQRTPDETVKRMKEIPKHQNLFKSNIVSGIGAPPATGGLTPGTNGQVDCRNIDMATYEKLRKENPAALGL